MSIKAKQGRGESDRADKNQGDREGRPGSRERYASYGRSEIIEQDLAQRWHALPLMQSLPLVNGDACQLCYAGRSGGPQGPDIRDAVLQFAPEHADAAGRVAGDVEFHIRCSDWYAHQHHTDPRYNNVILHVVLLFDSAGPVLRQDGGVVPVCSLNDLVPTIFPQPLWPCQCIVPSMDTEARAVLLQRAGLLRFEQKAQPLLVQLRLSQSNHAFSAYDVCLIPALVEALGYGRDRAFFRAVGQRLVGLPGAIPEPAGRTAEPSPLDAGRLRISGQLVEQWRAKGAWETMRNVVTGIEGDKVLEEGRPQGSPPILPTTPAPTMNGDGQEMNRSHSRGGGREGMGGDPCGRPSSNTVRPTNTVYPANEQTTNVVARLRAIFPGIGPARADILICNVVLPFAAAVGHFEQDERLLECARELFGAYPKLSSNQVTRSMSRQLGLEREPRNACQQQGLHYIYAQTCREKQCAACFVVGREM